MNSFAALHHHRLALQRSMATAALITLLLLPGCNSLRKRSQSCDACPSCTCHHESQHRPTAAPSDADLPAQGASYPITPEISAGGGATNATPTPYRDAAYQQATSPPTQYTTVTDLTRRTPNIGVPSIGTPNIGVPIIGGEQLGDPQTTATQHALRLKQENEQLHVTADALTAENERLRSELKRYSDLLEQSETAIESATLSLTSALKANQQLKHEVGNLRLQQQRKQLDTDRLLQSIRGELDDVLMREMTQEEK